MSVTDDIPNPIVSEATPEALGDELARSLRTRAEVMSEGVTAFAKTLSLDPDRLQVELVYLSIVTTQFAMGVALGTDESCARVGAALERALWSGPPWRATANGLTARLRDYRDAFNHPHPELGRAYVIGRTFARHCHCSHEIAVIEYGARAYMDQLPLMIALLRSVTLR